MRVYGSMLKYLLILFLLIPLHVEAIGDLRVWVVGDPHSTRDNDFGYSPLTNAIDDSINGGDDIPAGPAFAWDIAVIAGDIFGQQACPDAAAGVIAVGEFTDSAGASPNRFYPVMGNHDANEANDNIYNAYVDPMGTSNLSLVDQAMRKYPVSGTYDHYAFEVENILFLMLSDQNYGNDAFGRNCTTQGGYPAGRHDQDTFDWLKSMVEANPGKISITVAHHSLYLTTAYTDYDEGYDEGIHGTMGQWADETGSSFVYAIEQCSKDGKDETESSCAI